jgi:hypothetical protein
MKLNGLFLPITICFSFTGLSLAQGIVGLPEMNILYKNYENVIQLGGENSGSYQLKCEGGVLKKNINSYTVLVTGNVKEVTLTVSQEGTKISDFAFKVKTLPQPNIFVSNLELVGTNEESSCMITVGYPDECPLVLKTNVTSWTVSFQENEKPIKGTGSTLSSFVLEQIKKYKGKGQMIIECNYEGFGKTSQIKTVFTL